MNCIKYFRKKFKLSQEYVAQEIGCSRFSLVRYENGELTVTFSIAERLARLFETDWQVFQGKDNQIDEPRQINLTSVERGQQFFLSFRLRRSP